MIFIMVVDWIMRKLENQGKRGIQWTLTTQLHDLDNADDICLLSQKLQCMQTETAGCRENWSQGQQRKGESHEN